MHLKFPFHFYGNWHFAVWSCGPCAPNVAWTSTRCQSDVRDILRVCPQLHHLELRARTYHARLTGELQPNACPRIAPLVFVPPNDAGGTNNTRLTTRFYCPTVAAALSATRDSAQAANVPRTTSASVDAKAGGEEPRDTALMASKLMWLEVPPAFWGGIEASLRR